MNGLIVWLRAQLDVDEQWLRLQDEHLDGHERPYDPQNPTDPARGLREVQAKRDRLDYLTSQAHSETCRLIEPGDTSDWPCSCGLDAMRLMFYRFEAGPYTDRPGFRPGWLLFPMLTNDIAPVAGARAHVATQVAPESHGAAGQVA